MKVMKACSIDEASLLESVARPNYSKHPLMASQGF